MRWLVLTVMMGTTAWAGPRRGPPEPLVDPHVVASAQNLRRIAMLEELLQLEDHPKRAEMLFRLAELYREEARLQSLQQVGAWNEACEADVDACDTPLDLSAAHQPHDRALRLYQTVLRQYPTYERADEARFALALGLLERDLPTEAGAQLRSYVRLHPDGEHAHLAWLQLGELAFDAGKAGVAVRAFTKAASFKNGEQRPQALHRLAWALKNVGEDHRAVDVLKQVVALTRASTADEHLATAARRDLVRFAVEIGALAEVESLLGHGDDRRVALTHAAVRHAEQGEVDAAVQLWLRVATESPAHPERPAALVAVTEQLRVAGRFTDAVKMAQRLEREHRPDGAWARSNVVNPSNLIEARDAAERALREVALSAHVDARKLRQRRRHSEAAEAARVAYESWLQAFSDRPQAPGVRFGLAELHYESRRWADAYDAYRGVWRSEPDSELGASAVEGGLHAAEAWLKADPAPAPAQGVDLATVAPRPLTKPELALVEAARVATERGTADRRAITYRVAYVLYEAFHFEEAGARFREVIALDPGSADAERAAHLIADMLAIRQAWPALAENAAFYAQQEELGTESFRGEMAALARQAQLKAIEADLARTDDRTAAASALLTWVDAHEDRAETRVLSVALRDAAAHLESADDPAGAAAARRRFLDHPRLGTDAHRLDQWLALGDDLERLGRWASAAEAYAAANAIDASDPRLIEASWRAAALLEALEDGGAATAWLEVIERAGPEDPRWYGARLSHASLSGDPTAWASLLDDEAAPVAVRLTAALTLDEPNARDRALKALPDSVPPEALGLVAELQFRALEGDFDDFRTSRLAGRSGLSPAAERRHFARQLAALQASARRLREGYARVAATGSGRWGLAAAVRLAELQEQWARILEDSDDPRHLTPSQLDLYRQELADQIWVRRDTAARGYAAALKRAFELQLYTSATEAARARLAELEPEDWPATFEAGPAGPWWSAHRPRQSAAVESAR